jgi:DNA polymerase-3 subunit gamma/tau
LNLGNILKPTQKPVEIKSEEKNGTVATQDQSVTEKQVKEAWTEYAEERKSNVAEYHLLNREFEFRNNQITIHLANPIEEPLLLSIKTNLVEFLRKKLNNNSIQVTSMLKEFQSKKVAYTNKDKFEHLAEKNPLLNDLKDRFGLDPDF